MSKIENPSFDQAYRTVNPVTKTYAMGPIRLPVTKPEMQPKPLPKTFIPGEEVHPILRDFVNEDTPRILPSTIKTTPTIAAEAKRPPTPPPLGGYR